MSKNEKPAAIRVFYDEELQRHGQSNWVSQRIFLSGKPAPTEYHSTQPLHLRPHTLYILQCMRSGYYYVGISSHLNHRIQDHLNGQVDFTRRYGVADLLYAHPVQFPTSGDAMQIETDMVIRLSTQPWVKVVGGGKFVGEWGGLRGIGWYKGRSTNDDSYQMALMKPYPKRKMKDITEIRESMYRSLCD